MTRATEILAALEHGIDVAGRKVFLTGGIDEDSVGVAIRGLYMLGQHGSSPIELYVSSEGGDLDDALALHDVTRTIKVPVHTIALGKCMSAAPLLVACGHPGQRWATPNTSFMLHAVVTDEVGGTAANLETYAKSTREAGQLYAKLLARYTKKNAAHWARLLGNGRDHLFGADQAVSWGLVDHIWEEKG